MLSRRDREMARAIGREVRTGGAASPDLGPMPGYFAWPIAAACGVLSYLARDIHSLFWGIPLFIAASCLSAHAVFRFEFPGSRSGDLFFLGLYSLAFAITLARLWTGEYLILSAMFGLAAVVAVLSLIGALMKRRDS